MSVSARVRAHIRSNLVGYIALFCFAVGGPAYANHGAPDSISTEDIIDGEVRTADINNSNGVRSVDVRDDTLPDGGLAAVDLAAGSVGSSELATDAVGSSSVQDGSLLGADLAFETVGTSQLGDLAVTRDKIANGAVNSQKFADFSLLNADIGSAQVDNRTLATGSATSRVLLDGAVASADVATNTLTSADIDEASVSGLDRCPAGSTRFGRLCARSDGIDRSWNGAVQQCASLSLRLPTLGEARTLGINHNVPGIANDAFWTDGLFDSFGDHAWIVDEDGNIADVPTSQSRDAVCVIPPFN